MHGVTSRLSLVPQQVAKAIHPQRTTPWEWHLVLPVCLSVSPSLSLRKFPSLSWYLRTLEALGPETPVLEADHPLLTAPSA